MGEELDLDKIINNKLGTYIIRTDNPQNTWIERFKDYLENEDNTVIHDYDISDASIGIDTAITDYGISDAPIGIDNCGNIINVNREANIHVDVADISTSYDNTKIYLSHDETCNIIKNIFEKDMILDTRIKNYIVNKINTYRTLNDESYNKFA
jgi:hypothetical protein